MAHNILFWDPLLAAIHSAGPFLRRERGQMFILHPGGGSTTAYFKSRAAGKVGPSNHGKPRILFI